jgi:subtilisin-like proprotein convertase family protein
MRNSKLLLTIASISLLAAGTALADKQAEMDEFLLKPWALADLPQLPEALADVDETEPLNNTCPGEPYTLDDTYHGAITSNDEDWICFVCDLGAEMTAGTDADAGLPTVDTVIELYDSSCTGLLTSNDDGGPGLYSLIDGFVAPYTGAYYLKIRGFSSGSEGNYIAQASCTTPVGPGGCPVGTYKASKINVNQDIPDNDPAGLVTPAIKFNPQPGVEITDVVIDICMDHTWAGDLVITLKHTSSGGDVLTADLLNRPGVPETSFGCAGDLICDPESKYYFGSDPSLEPLGEFDCPSEIPGACYAVAIENPGALEIFRGLPKGDGYWELCIVDNAAGDTGSVFNWSVHLLCESGPVSVEEASWAEIKANYRR